MTGLPLGSSTAASAGAVGYTVLLALVLGSLCAASGTVLLRLGAAGGQSLMDFLNPRLISGLTLYLLGAVLWIFAMSRAQLSLVYPFTALTFVLVMLAGQVLLGEKATPGVYGGSALIFLGIGWIAVGATR
ncbi:hypothetical protein [Qipengyuania qiaonensis]|uniref:EamA domain-containing protein n=1 Tax=Qipengyuania qiaonensis TaxID=2867240 RepID=A0ABS7J347_9SPHN|nr:hypothetical protein [Qipengyuania qiaonensis]MBX7481747.1 hypothetical protein [Qipengyuania qiaonensis]